MRIDRREKFRHEFQLVSLKFIDRPTAKGSLLDISQTGAKISINFQAQVDEILELIIGASKNKFSAKVVWTKTVSTAPVLYHAGILFSIPFANFSELFAEIRSSHYGEIMRLEHIIAGLNADKRSLLNKINELEGKLKRQQSWWQKIRKNLRSTR